MIYYGTYLPDSKHCKLLLPPPQRYIESWLSKNNHNIERCKLEQRRDDHYKHQPVMYTNWGRKIFIFPALVTAERKRMQVSMVRRIGHRNSFDDLVGEMRLP